MDSQHPTISNLQQANSEWIKAVLEKDPEFFKRTAKGQSPKILWIGCADSRVPESVIVAANPGDIFVHRNIANQFHLNDDSALSVLAYAVGSVGVEHVIVAGHTKCGGCVEAWKICAHPPPPPVLPNTPLIRWITPLVKLAGELGLASKEKDEAVEILVKESVKRQVENIVKTDVIQKAWAEKKNVHVHGLVYELNTGKLTDLGVTRKGQ